MGSQPDAPNDRERKNSKKFSFSLDSVCLRSHVNFALERREMVVPATASEMNLFARVIASSGPRMAKHPSTADTDLRAEVPLSRCERISFRFIEFSFRSGPIAIKCTRNHMFGRFLHAMISSGRGGNVISWRARHLLSGLRCLRMRSVRSGLFV